MSATDFEVIVIDDGSEDETAEVCRRIGEGAINFASSPPTATAVEPAR